MHWHHCHGARTSLQLEKIIADQYQVQQSHSGFMVQESARQCLTLVYLPACLSRDSAVP